MLAKQYLETQFNGAWQRNKAGFPEWGLADYLRQFHMFPEQLWTVRSYSLCYIPVNIFQNKALDTVLLLRVLRGHSNGM